MQRGRVSGVKPNGYALLLILFLVAALALVVTAAKPNLLSQGRREREQEMIWRGRQYVRAIRLYYQKTHRLPTQLEDLYKPKTGIRFMRQPYKDPMNSSDGSWRLICVGPAGQLVGSLKPNRNAFFFGAAASANFAGSLASRGGSSASSSSFSGSGNSLFSTSSFNDRTFSRTSPLDPQTNATVDATSILGAPNDQGSQAGDTVVNPPKAGSQAAPTAPASTLGQTTIVGVGSKINKSSIAKYDGAKNYLQFEFIWNGLTAGSGVPSP